MSGREQAEGGRVIAGDPGLDATVRNLDRGGVLIRLFTLMGSTPHRRRVIAELAAHTRNQNASARAGY